MDSRYLTYLAKANISQSEYKIVLLLLTKSMTATQVARELCTLNQNKHKYFKKLQGKGLIEIDHVDGRNKYYKAITDIKKLSEVMPGQIKF